MSPKQNLSTYSTEMLKIRSKLYPDSQRVMDAIFGQIEMLVDMIIDTDRAIPAHVHSRSVPIMAYRTAPHLTTFSALRSQPNEKIKLNLITIDHEARLVYTPNGAGFCQNPVVTCSEELMDIHQALATIYSLCLEDLEESEA